ncbi:MAG: class I SAM-dependent methyltransferase [Methylococcaceae bacterium]|nr:class I SAM-dependent methyltransferase [Methylococcaceae bacterium]
MSDSKVIYDEYKSSGFREELLTYLVNPVTQKGVEIGALNNPIVKPTNGDIKFIDYTDTDTLKLKHQAYSDRVNKMVNVDYVWSGSGSLAEIVGDRHCFDYFIASHVIEHVPNMLGWFRGINEVLKHGGIFNLAIPDKRYTFDVNCPLSTVGQLVEADLLLYHIPSIRQMFDHTYYAKNIIPGAIWGGAVDVKALPHTRQLKPPTPCLPLKNREWQPIL